MNARRPDPRCTEQPCLSCGKPTPPTELVVMNGRNMPPITLCDDCVMQASDLIVGGVGGLLERIADAQKSVRELREGTGESAVITKLIEFATVFGEILEDSTMPYDQRCGIAAGVALGLQVAPAIPGAAGHVAALFETGTEALRKHRRRPYSPPKLTKLGDLEPGTTDPDAAFDQIERALERGGR